MPSDLPILPSVPPPGLPPPRVSARTDAQKYGALFWAGLVGLVAVVAMVGWFGIGIYRMSDVLGLTYTLHDPKEPEPMRVQAAYAIARSGRATDRQLWDMAIRTTNPPLARYVLAEALTADAVRADVRGYSLAVARSPGWPGWFRWLIFRPMALRAGEGVQPSAELVAEIRDALPEGAARLWVAFFVLAGGSDDHALGEWAREAMKHAKADDALRPLAVQFDDLLRQKDPGRRRIQLERATHWMRHNEPQCEALWRGWEIRDGRLGPAERDVNPGP
jgi:hypothetical protein